MLSEADLKHWGTSVCTAIFVVLGALLPAFSAPVGSKADIVQPQPSLRGSYHGACVSDALCALSYASADTADAPAPKGVVVLGSGAPGRRIFTGPGDPTGPATNVDWSVSLRGTYENNSSGNQFGMALNPSVDVTHLARGVEYVLGADAELVASSGSDYRLSQGSLSYTSTRTLSQVTLLRISMGLSAAQASASDPNLATGVARAPIVVNGSAGVTVERKMGRFDVALRGSIDRDIYGDSTIAGGALQDNGERNRTGFEGGARISHRLSGVLGVFVDGSVRRDIHDLPSSGSGTSQDSWTYAIRGGLNGNWGDRFTAEASVGYAQRQFDSSTIDSVPVVLADLTMRYRPTRTLELRAGIATDISTPDPTAGASTRIDYDAFLDAAYQINQRFALRASIAGDWAQFAQTGEIRRGYSAGMGVDYTLSPYTSLNADYTYAVSENTANTTETSHRITAGVTYAR